MKVSDRAVGGREGHYQSVAGGVDFVDLRSESVCSL